MKFFSYALVYAFFVFLIYLFIRIFRFAYVHIKAYVTRRKLLKVVEKAKKAETETKKDD